MATNTTHTTPTTTTTRKLATVAPKALVAGTAPAPHNATVQGPVASASWHYPALANNSKRPFTPKAGTTIAAVLGALANGPATVVACQAAVDALGLAGKHQVQALCKWLAANRGIGFACQGGMVSKL